MCFEKTQRRWHQGDSIFGLRPRNAIMIVDELWNLQNGFLLRFIEFYESFVDASLSPMARTNIS